MTETNNKKKFDKLTKITEKNNLVFISSNSGTGKSTHFKWLFVRRALNKGEMFDVFFRFENEIEQKFNNESWLKPPLNASKRLLKLANKVEIIQEQENYFLIRKDTKEKLAQALAVNIQKRYKSTENPIYTCKALYDEVMPDDNQYCTNEVYKFSRLIDTRARNRDYKVVCLYNNTRPYFPYKESFEKAGALFIDFVGVKYGQPELKGIQKILSKSDYGEVYNNNNYQYFKEFYINYETKNMETLFYISIQDRLFAFKDCKTFYTLIPKNKVKKNKEVFSIAMENNDFFIADRQSGLIETLSLVLNRRKLFVNRKKYTIYVKELADYLNLSYNIWRRGKKC